MKLAPGGVFGGSGGAKPPEKIIFLTSLKNHVWARSVNYFFKHKVANLPFGWVFEGSQGWRIIFEKKNKYAEKDLGWGSKFCHLVYPPDSGQKRFFLIFWPLEGSWGGPGGRKSIRCPPYFTNPWASLKRHTAIYIYIYIYIYI